jgi:hypothetical protein
VPWGSDWTVSQDEVQDLEEHIHDSNVKMWDIDTLSDLSGNADSPDGDVTLANATLFIRNAIWWREMCKAVATGDTGRIWEILKVRYAQPLRYTYNKIARCGYSPSREVGIHTMLSICSNSTATSSGSFQR